MSLAIVYSRASTGIRAPLVTVEVHLSYGLAGLHMVGLPEATVKESKDRVRSALMNSHFEFPIRRITVNLAPADLPKEGGRFDLPIALGILAASGQIPKNVLNEYEFVGELALSGELRPVHGVLPVVLGAHQANRKLIVPAANTEEAALVKQAAVFTAKHLLEICAALQGKQTLPQCNVSHALQKTESKLDFSDVKGQPHAKRALEIAACGSHSVIFVGPPGAGKTMLASRLPGILPELTDEEALESASIASVSSGGFNPHDWRQIPFRSPHHTSSSVALVGGGRPPKPGEISLAHRGVLFLDELPEFQRHALECLREPLESGQITISRAAYQTVFPAQFQLIAAMNPCPCGYAGSKPNRCECSPEQIKRYAGKISGPLLDRIDMQVTIRSVSPETLAQIGAKNEECSQVINKRVCEVRQLQLARQGKYNAALMVVDLKQCQISSQAEKLLQYAMNKLELSARVYHRLLKVARTISDIDQKETIDEQAVSEALTYRSLDHAKSGL